jgi:hypothetical protein
VIERQQDIWAAGEKAHAIVITTNGSINANGTAVMGRGVALEAKERWPRLPHMLGYWLKTTGVRGGPHLYIIPPRSLYRQPWALVCFPVKYLWKQHASPVLIEQSIKELIDSADMFRWQRVVMARPGCGNGNLDWESQVKPLCARLDDRFLVVWK